MVNLKTCPSVTQWQEVLGRPVVGEELDSLTAHLEACEPCTRTMDNLLGDDSMAAALRSHCADDTTPLPQINALIARLRDLRNIDVGRTEPPVAAISANAPAGPAPTYNFLAAARGPNELGWLGSFRILKELGAGGMGMVFLAEDPMLERRVALKVMRPELAKPEQKQRFLREARAAAKVKHDHVVTIYQVGVEGDVPFLAMDLLEGESLDDWLKRGQKASPAVVCRIGREVAEGLAAAHGQGLIHRDIKPGNLWLENLPGEPGASPTRWRVKILDFGLARATQGQEQLTSQGVIVGTPAYASPEQFRGEPEVRSDLFSLGAVLYRLCTGRMPFKGTDVLSIVASVSLDTPMAIREINPDVPPALADLVKQLLAKEPKDRPASARAVADRLAAVERDLSQSSRFSEPSRTLEPSQASELTQAASLPLGSGHIPTARRRSAVVLALAACFAVLLGGIIYVQTDNGTFEIKTFDPNVKVTVEQDGKHIGILDEKSQQQLSVRAGKYTLKLVGGDREDLELIVEQGVDPVTLKRGQKVIATVQRRERPMVAKSSFPPLDPVWVDKVQKMPPKHQAQEVAAELKRRNPKFDSKISPSIIMDDAVFEFGFISDFVTDITPLQVLRQLGGVLCMGSELGKGALADLSPLQGLKLTYLLCANTRVADLTPLKGMPLEDLNCNGTNIKDLTPLKGMPLKRLGIGWTAVADVTPLAGMPLLTELMCGGAKITDLSPLRGAPLKYLHCDFEPDRDAAVLRSIRSLIAINGARTDEFWKQHRLSPFPPLDSAWVKKVQSLPPAEQVKEVAAELQRRNPGFDGKVTHGIFNGAVIVLSLQADHVTDITPVRVLSALTALHVYGSVPGKGRLRDLSPLKGMRLTNFMCDSTEVDDLTPLRGMQLTYLFCSRSRVSNLSTLEGMPLQCLFCSTTKVSDLSPLKGLPLSNLDCSETPVRDLSPLRGLPLSFLNISDTGVADLAPLADSRKLGILDCHDTKVRDLSPLRGQPLLYTVRIHASQVDDLTPLKDTPLGLLTCDFKPERDTQVLRSIKSLETINGRPAKDVLDGLVKPIPPLLVAWLTKVQSLPAEEQVKEVTAELKRRNPGFDDAVKPTIENGKVTELEIVTSALTDISPVKALADLRSLACFCHAPMGTGKLADLKPLQGMRLKFLNCERQRIADLSPLKGMPIEQLYCSHTRVEDLGPVKDLPLVSLGVAGTRVADLSPLRGTRVQNLSVAGTPVRDL